MTVSAVNQFEIGTTPALLMGATTVYGITAIRGLDLPTIRNNDLDLIGNGVYAAGDRLGGRTIGLDFRIVDRSTLATSLATFATAWQSTNTDVTLTYRLPGQAANRYANGRPRRAAWTLKYDEWGFGYVTASVDFFCQDPRIFLSADNSVVIF